MFVCFVSNTSLKLVFIQFYVSLKTSFCSIKTTQQLIDCHYMSNPPKMNYSRLNKVVNKGGHEQGLDLQLPHNCFALSQPCTTILLGVLTEKKTSTPKNFFKIKC